MTFTAFPPDFSSLSPWILALLSLLILLNLLSFFLYGWDKLSAILKWRRVRERTLWLSAFLGGTIGALLGILIWRHKISKPSFLFVLAIILLIQIAIIASILT